MEINSILRSFNQTLDLWIGEMEKYDYHQLCLQPEPGSWSLGQVYNHLIEVTNYFIQDMETCLVSNDNTAEDKSAESKIMFMNNSFPDLQLKGPADDPEPPQPANKAELREGMKDLKIKINLMGEEIVRKSSGGKTKHPGHRYFDAKDWFHWAEMHVRHHLRQKERIDNFLKNKR